MRTKYTREAMRETLALVHPFDDGDDEEEAMLRRNHNRQRWEDRLCQIRTNCVVVVVMVVAMVDDQYDDFVRNRSSGKDATSRSIIAAILLLLYPIMIGRAKGLPETSSLIQLPRSADHKTRVVISVDEFGAKGNGFDDDTLPCRHAPTVSSSSIPLDLQIW
ncbi:hypothetical protein B296_00021989 [Ensete ventricosum]|uniref:Uncharacterized protein n=1 Tax=Ensete ventricosum TaxID=4639 RepID=A0A427AAH8_ENSVE|nr:hypothetical protein B296_00021989 [Ensete ventricosum]